MTDNSNNKLAMAVGAGTVLGVASLLYLQSSEAHRQHELRREKVRDQKQKLQEKKLLQDFLEDAKYINAARKTGDDKKVKEIARQRLARGKSVNRRVNVFFDENDRMMEVPETAKVPEEK